MKSNDMWKIQLQEDSEKTVKFFRNFWNFKNILLKIKVTFTFFICWRKDIEDQVLKKNLGNNETEIFVDQEFW